MNAGTAEQHDLEASEPALEATESVATMTEAAAEHLGNSEALNGPNGELVVMVTMSLDGQDAGIAVPVRDLLPIGFDGEVTDLHVEFYRRVV